MVSPATEIPIVIGSRYPWCRSVITPDAENDACLGVSKEMGCRIIEANVLYRMCETCVQSSIDQIGHDVRVIAVNAAISH